VTVEPIYARERRLVGASTAALERGAREGQLTRLRPGVYADAVGWSKLAGHERHLLRMAAIARTFRSRPIFSHHSAAAIWGLPILGEPAVVQVSFEGPHGMAKRHGVRATRTTFEDGDVVEHAGYLVTSLARTAVDLARSRPLAHGVAALDHAIRSGAIDRALLEDDIARRRPFVGVRRLERAHAHAHGLSESPLESVSMARFAEFGWPAPEQQVSLVAPSGKRYRVDFLWRESGVVGEADGRAKYTTADDLWREKRREDDLREVVPRFVRWEWDDAWHGRGLAARLERAGFPRVPNHAYARLHA
jgi:hypothetical protein